MLKTVGLLALGALLGAGTAFFSILQPRQVAQLEHNGDLAEAFTAFSDAMREAGDFVQQHPWYGSGTERAEAYRHIARITMGALQQQLLIDPDFPYFYQIDPFNKSGMDNADQRYLVTVLNGDGVYRVWGKRGTSSRLDFSLYEEDPLSASLATLPTEALDVDVNGEFEVFVGGTARQGNWLPMTAGRKRLMVRQIHSDWADELPGAIHIDRIDSSRPRYPQLEPGTMANRLIDAANHLAGNVRRWPEFSRTRIAALLPANRLSPPRDVAASGGLSGRIMLGGHFELGQDEALLIKAWPTNAQYQGIQLGHHWWASIDYANRQSSLTAEQAFLSSDGAIYFVISAADPGCANWLDTAGFNRGVIMMRYDGLQEAQLASNKVPVAKLIKLAELRDWLPADEPEVTVQQRQQQIAARRRHVQQRFGM